MHLKYTDTAYLCGDNLKTSYKIQPTQFAEHRYIGQTWIPKYNCLVHVKTKQFYAYKHTLLIYGHKVIGEFLIIICTLHISLG